MKYIWSPWRMSYIQSNKNGLGCVFCDEIAKVDGYENLVISRGVRNFVILNRYPYTSGHLMIVPYEHQPSIEYLDENTRAEMIELSNQCLKVLRSCGDPQGFNIGVNIGEAGGAGIVEHVHLHVVPRWVGDTNFMSSLGETRVVPETLEETFDRLQQAWKANSL